MLPPPPSATQPAALIDYEKLHDEQFAAAVKKEMETTGASEEPAQRMVARYNTNHHNALVRIQNRRQGIEPAPASPVSPRKARASAIFALLDELKVPRGNQLDFMLAARATEDPLGWVRQKVEDVANGLAELPGCKKPASSQVAADAAGQIISDRAYYLAGLEEAMLACGFEINDVTSWHAIELRFDSAARVLFSYLGLSDREVMRELHRCSNLKAFRGLAGTPEERIAARGRLAAAEKLCEGANSELAKMEAKIATLQEKAAAMRKERDDAASDVQQRDGAIESLLQNTVDENFLIPPRRLLGAWPEEGAIAYVEHHVGKEPGIELREPERVPMGYRQRNG